ncbi:hypothetical protein [Desulfogranum japonicum]|uniref:hypothetical protein n=1 Tax=Desulfogranum japonicum TaxID=231447 RepID=UPI0003F5B1BD|nr:hypothetical protein [Desulfogranum japonicum]
MPRRAKKLTKEQKRKRKEAKAERQRKYQWVMMNGKQVRIKRPPTINGIPEDEYIEKYADPIWLQQNGMYEILHAREVEGLYEVKTNVEIKVVDKDEEIPF